MTNFWGMLYSLNLSFPNVQHTVFRIVPCLSLNVNATQVNTCFVTEQCELVITAEASLPLSYSVPMCGSRPCPQLSALPPPGGVVMLLAMTWHRWKERAVLPVPLCLTYTPLLLMPGSHWRGGWACVWNSMKQGTTAHWHNKVLRGKNPQGFFTYIIGFL